MADDVKAQVRNTYQETASNYDNIRFVRICAGRLVDLAQLQPGESILDVATGTGHLALAAAQAVGPSGKVTGLDLTREMLEQAKRKAEAKGVTNAEWREGDAERPPFPDATFDAVICASGIFFLPNQLAALREWRRVLKPGGQVLFSTFGKDNNQYLGDLAKQWQGRYGLTVFEAPTPLPDPSQCQRLLDEADFADVTVTPERHDYYFHNGDEYWAEFSNTHARVALARLSAHRLEEFRKDLLGDIESLAGPQGICRPLALNLARGRKRQ
jgi:ubiquinone/menaquinone biosynthesis C-methylase UbiE